MKILITGGHLTPALAVIEKIPKDWEILFVGRKYALEGDKTPSLEYNTITSMGIDFFDLKAGRLQRTFTKHTVPSLMRIPKTYLASFNILRKSKPDVILGFGGYVSVPVVIAGKILKIPTLVHEQTLNAGASNKLLKNFADKVLISWESSLRQFPKEKTIVTGNPVRKDFFKPIDLPDGSEPLIFVFGGSTGSQTINSLVEKTIDRLLRKYRVLHMTGPLDFERLSRLSKKIKKAEKYMVVENFLPSHMGYVLQNSTLVISRSGINTVTELIEFEKPAILIPLPSGQKNEQEENARFLQKLGLATVIEQKNVTSQNLFEAIEKMFADLEKYKLKNKNVLIPDAADKIISEVKDVANKKREKKI